MLSSIDFRRTDVLSENFENFTLELAEHFKTKRLYLPVFCNFIILTKKWKFENLQESLNKWKNSFGSVRERRKLTDIIERGFSACASNEDIPIIRGCMVEALVIGKHGGQKVLEPNTKRKAGWGAKVLLNTQSGTKEVVYNCVENIYPDCGSRKTTVDLGVWDGYHGTFYECKAHPIRFNCKEIQYMKLLQQVLSDMGASSEYHFVCPEREESIRMRLEDSFSDRFGRELKTVRIMGMEQLSA